MHHLVVVGTVSLALSTLIVACGDDDEPSPPSNSAGSAGTAGSAGSGGMGGSGTAGSGMGGSGTAGSGMGGSGTAGSGMGGSGTGGSGMGGSGGLGIDAGLGVDAGSNADAGGEAAPPCTGCLELRVPFTATGESAFFQLAFGATDLSDTVATFRVAVRTLDEGGQLLLTPYASDDSDFTFGPGTSATMNAATFGGADTFFDVEFDVAAMAAGNADFDTTGSIALGLQVFAGATLAVPTSAILYLDSVTLTGTSGLTDLTFTSDAEGFAVNANAGLQTATVTEL